MQQLPRKGGVRECFIPREGYVFVACDYSFQELCTLAQSCIQRFDHSRLADTINAGRDPHLYFASIYLGMTYEDAVAKRKTKRVKEARQMIKAPQFGYPGGMGPAALIDYAWQSYGVRIDMETATRLRRIWFEAYPEMEEHLGWIQAKLNASPVMGYSKGRTVKVFDLQLPCGRVRGRGGYTAGAITIFQGSAADITKEALIAVAREAYTSVNSPLWGCPPVAFIHDEIIIEAPRGRFAPAADRLRDIMISTMEKHTPDVKVSAEVVAMLRWYKGAEEVRNERGELQIWS